jgi:hypothetical protein
MHPPDLFVGATGANAENRHIQFTSADAGGSPGSGDR